MIVDRKEFADHRSGSSGRVELANTSCQHRPRYTTRESQDVRVDSSFCPSALLFLGDSLFAHRRIARNVVRKVATFGTRFRIMSVTLGPVYQHLSLCCEIDVPFRLRCEASSTPFKISSFSMSNASPASGKLTRANNRSTSTPEMTVFMMGTKADSTAYFVSTFLLIWMHMTYRNLSDSRPIPQHLLKLAKEMFLVYMSWTNADRIDIGTRSMDTESTQSAWISCGNRSLPIRSRSVDPPSCFICYFLRQARLDRNVVYEFSD